MVKTQRLSMVAILGALSFVFMLFNFPIIPGADFLKVELSILPILVGLVIYDLKAAYSILLLRSVLKLLLNNEGVNTYIGLPMNMVSLAIFVTIFALIWKNRQNIRSFVVASLLASLALTATMLVLNYVYAVPLYATFAQFDIRTSIGLANYLLAMVLPFNLVQGAIFSLAFGATITALKPVLGEKVYAK